MDKIECTVSIDSTDIVDSVIDTDEAFPLIVAIDQGMQDWEFTKQCAEYFVSELMKCRTEFDSNYFQFIKDAAKILESE